MKKIKIWLLLIVSFLSLTISITNNIVSVSHADIHSWLLCEGPWGDENNKKLVKNLYQAGNTELIPYLLSSKASLATSETDNNPFNKVLEMGGYKFGSENKSKSKSPFDEFGFRGIQYSSYIGEWKYYNIDACKTNKENTVSGDYGEYYNGRLDPLTTYAERFSSTDPRVQQLENNKYILSLKTMLSNIFLNINKFFISIGLALIGLTFSDISDVLGITNDFTQSTFKSLYSNFFVPLEYLMFLLSALYVFWHGIIKREYRQSLINGLLKPLLVLFVSTVFILYPNATTLPNKIVTLGQTVIISSLGHSVTSKSSDDICASSDGLEKLSESKDLLNSAGDSMRSILGCRMWKEFVFKPWVKGQWNTDDYKKLNKLDNINSKWVKEPKVKLGEREITNWAVYQLSIQSGLHIPTDGEWSSYVNGLDKDWYRIVDALSNYDEEVIRYGEGGYSSDGDSSGGGGSRSSSAEAFFKENGESAKKIGQESGLYASVMLAQAALESGYGKSPSGDYNYFGIKCFNSNCKYLQTREVYGGVSTVIRDGFQNFESKEAGWEGYAMFIWGKGAGADFTGASKAKSPTPQAAITAIKNAGYATDPNYISMIMSIINTYDLTKYDTPDKNPTKPEKYHKYGSSSGGGSSSSDSSSGGSSGNYKVVKQIDSKPLAQWDYWVGNIQGTRMGESLLATLFGIVGIIGPLVLSAIASAYGIGITLLTMIAPFFLLLGLWSGKGNTVMTDYLGLLLSTMYKKVIASFLVVLSVILTSTIMEQINSIGIFKAMIYMTIIAIILVKKHQEILNTIGRVNLGSMNFEGFTKGLGMIKNTAKFTAKGTMSAVAGYQGASKIISDDDPNKGKYKRQAAFAGAAEFVRAQLATTETGRRANSVFEAGRRDLVRKGKVFDPNTSYSQHICEICGRFIEEGENYWDVEGHYYCMTCAEEQDAMYHIYERGSLETFDNTDENEKIVIPDSVQTSFEGQQIQAKQSNMKELAEKVGFNSFDKEIDNDALNKMVQSSIAKAIYDKDFMKQTLESKQNNKVIFDKAKVPDFLLKHFEQDEIEGFTHNNTREEAINRFPNAMTRAWIDWYKDNISNEEDSINQFIGDNNLEKYLNE